MNTLKKTGFLLGSLLLTASLCCCSNSAAESQTDSASSSTAESSSAGNQEYSEDDTSHVTYGAYTIDHDDTITDDCAALVKAYFTAIENQDYSAYESTLYDYYFQVYSDYLQTNYQYGMETCLEQQHQALLDAAEAESVQITGISLSLAVPSESEDSDTDVAQNYLEAYNSIFGDDFSQLVTDDVDEVLDVAFTMTALCDGEEKTIMEQYDHLIVCKDGVYSILG